MRPGLLRMPIALCCGAMAVASPWAVVSTTWAQVGPPSDPRGPMPSVRLESNRTDCPAAEQLASVLGHAGVSVAAEATGWVLSYGKVPPSAVDPRASLVWMDLTSPTGELVARRRFPHSADDGGDCGAIASAMSAVVERSLHELGWTGGEPLPESVRSTRPAATPAATVTPPPRPPRLIVGMGPTVGTSARAGVNVLLEARLRIAGPVSVRVGGGLLAKDDTEVVGNGRARVSSRPLAAAVLSTFLRGRTHFDAGAVFMTDVDRGSTDGLAQDSAGRRAALAAGVVLGVGRRLSPRWRLALEVQGVRAVAAGAFVVTVDGQRRTVLAPPTWQGTVGAKLEFVVWP